jgi:hypothetical protein
MKNLGNMMKQAQQMQARMAEMQEKLGELEVEGHAGGGLVMVALNGRGEARRVKVDKNLCDPEETEVLEDLIVAAINDAKAKVEAQVQEETSKVMGDLKLPPGFKMPF